MWSFILSSPFIHSPTSVLLPLSHALFSSGDDSKASSKSWKGLTKRRERKREKRRDGAGDMVS